MPKESWGIRLERLRVSKGLSKNKFAQTIGISHVQLMKYEKGTSQPTLPVIEKISDVLNVSVDYLIKGDSFSSTEALEPNLQDIIRKYKNLPAGFQEDFKTMCDTFINVALKNTKKEELEEVEI